MNAKLLFSVLIFALSAQIAACGRNAVSFSEDIQPILQASCVSCHNGTIDSKADKDAMGEGAQVSGFSVADYAGVMAGTSLGPMVVPGSRLSSSLYLVVAGKTDPAIRMPPHHDESWAEGRGVPLSAAQIEMVGAWIDQGAKNN
jgi:hypothetical protein